MALNKRRWLTLLQATVTILLIVVVFRSLDPVRFAGYVVRLGFLPLLLVAALGLVKLGLLFLNWESALRINPGFDAPRSQIWHSFWAGQSLALVVPGGHATFGKAFLIDNTSKKATALTVLFEKFYQGWVSWFTAALAVGFYFTEVPRLSWLALIVAVLLTPAVIPLLFGRLGIDRATRDNYLRLCPRILALQTLQTLITVFQYWYLIDRLTPVGFVRCLIAIPLTLFANTIPVTIAGLGLRETFVAHLMPRYGVDPAAAVCVSLTIFVIHSILPGLVGLYSLHVARKAVR